MVLHVVLASASQCGASAVLTPDTPGPIAAESGVEDDVVVLEVLVDVAIVAANEASCGSSPVGGVGVGSRGIAGYTSTRPEPDVDPIAGPLHGVDAAVSVVEVGSIVVRARRLDGTAKATLAVAACQGAPVASVHRHLILASGVDPFDDVDFPAVWPVRACHPEGRPSAANTAGHVGEVKDDQAMGILSFACQANAVAASTRSYVCVINTECHLSIADVEEVLGIRSGLVDIVDVSVGWVIKLAHELASFRSNTLLRKRTVLKSNMLKKLAAE